MTQGQAFSPTPDPTDDLSRAALPTEPMIVRPSLLAALERFFVALGTIIALTLPFMVTAVLRTPPGRPTDPLLALFDLGATLVIPIIVSLVPAIQLAFTRYVFDAEGLREHVDLLTRTEKRVTWEKVTALQHRRTALDRILGIERLDVIAYGERGTTIKLVGLRKAADLRGMVAREMRQQASVERLFSND